MNICEKRLSELRNVIPEVSVIEAYQLQQNNAIIIDVRTLVEFQEQHIKNCIYLGRDFLEFKIEEVIPNTEQKIITACGGGFRSLFAAESLKNLGYNEVYNMAGGFRAWKAEGNPTSSD